MNCSFQKNTLGQSFPILTDKEHASSSGRTCKTPTHCAMISVMLSCLSSTKIASQTCSDHGGRSGLATIPLQKSQGISLHRPHKRNCWPLASKSQEARSDHGTLSILSWQGTKVATSTTVLPKLSKRLRHATEAECARGFVSVRG